MSKVISGEGLEEFDKAFEECAKMKPVFPVITKLKPDEGAHLNIAWGLTKRELFAAMAMQGMLAHPECPTWNVSEDAVKAADALLAELEKKS
jgi:hypothetical protein